eukprot:TRINITY_DN7515_c0_g1_i1.p1 TRINITY_DN7515_c0_g1~~TRINITY_DN7515_c0_g1_i1.p1  ORF type:complete len:406 (-),score=96.27 TRINITY_DN7515_c0_g1_i1:331-1548(-)
MGKRKIQESNKPHPKMRKPRTTKMKKKKEQTTEEIEKDKDGKLFSWNMLFAAALFAGIAVGYPLIVLQNDSFLDDIYYCFYHPLERVRDVSSFWLLFTTFFGGEVWGPKIYHTLGGPLLDGLLYPSRDVKVVSLYGLATIAHLEQSVSLEMIKDLPSQRLIFKDFYRELSKQRGEQKVVPAHPSDSELLKIEAKKRRHRFDKEDWNEFISTPHMVCKYLDLWINLVAFDKCRRLSLKAYESEVKNKAEFCYFQPPEIQLRAAKFFEALTNTKNEKLLNHMHSMSEMIEGLDFLSKSQNSEVAYYASKALVNVHQGKDNELQERWKTIVNQRETVLAKYAEPIAVGVSCVAIGLVYPTLKKFIFRMKSITSTRDAGIKAALGAVLLSGAVVASEFVSKREDVHQRE